MIQGAIASNDIVNNVLLVGLIRTIMPESKNRETRNARDGDAMGYRHGILSVLGVVGACGIS